MSQPMYHVAAIIVEDDLGRLVLQLRDDKRDISYPGHWGTWGGRVEDGEGPPEAAVREVYEELTLNVAIEALRYVTSIMLESPAREWHVFFWKAGTAVDRAIVNEGQRLGRFFMDEIAIGTLEGRPVHPVLLQLLEDFRSWREKSRTA
jgi:8-oxo-dGTP diphosphatase